MTKAIEYYIKKNVSNKKIKEYLNEVYNENLDQAEVDEAIKNIKKTIEKRKNVQTLLDRMFRNW